MRNAEGIPQSKNMRNANNSNNEHLYPENEISQLKKDCKTADSWSWLFGILAVIFCLLFCFSMHFKKPSEVSVSIKNEVMPKYDSATKAFYQYQYDRQLCIINIMLSEDYSSTVYKCPAGYNTIGFGHQIKNNEKIPSKIDFKTAFIILESDFNGCISYARELGYENESSKQLAVAHAIYCLGLGTVGNISDFKNDIMKYVFYRKIDGTLTQSENLRSARFFEKNLYEKKY